MSYLKSNFEALQPSADRAFVCKVQSASTQQPAANCRRPSIFCLHSSVFFSRNRKANLKGKGVKKGVTPDGSWSAVACGLCCCGRWSARQHSGIGSTADPEDTGGPQCPDSRVQTADTQTPVLCTLQSARLHRIRGVCRYVGVLWCGDWCVQSSTCSCLRVCFNLQLAVVLLCV